MIRLNDEQYWLYAAVDPETNKLFYTKLEPTTANVLAHSFPTELSEKHDVSDAVFLVDGSHSLQAACQRHGFDFRYEKHGNRNSVEHVFKEIICGTIYFSNYFQQHRSRNRRRLARILQLRMESTYVNYPTLLPRH
jgi:transposase-like protein